MRNQIELAHTEVESKLTGIGVAVIMDEKINFVITKIPGYAI